MARIDIAVDLIEPVASDQIPRSGIFSDAYASMWLAYSSAVSLKRIADNLDKIASGELTTQLFMQPINHYGEGLSEAIQNSIERGLRGINTNG